MLQQGIEKYDLFMGKKKIDTIVKVTAERLYEQQQNNKYYQFMTHFNNQQKQNVSLGR
mgnify:CR=1 FL=1